MLYKLNHFTHPIEKAQEVLEYFFCELRKQENDTFNLSLFPPWFNDEWLKGTFKTNFEFFFYNCKQNLSQEEIEYLCDCFRNNNKIRELCKDENEIVTPLSKMPEKIKNVVDHQVATNQNLFQWLYNYILSSKNSPILKLLDTNLNDHYVNFCNHNPPVCAFCGLESYTLIESEGRTDYDHYLSSSEYPFSAINLGNLFPMGLRCNQRVKSNDHILYMDFDNDLRRPVFYPYDKDLGFDYMDFNIVCKKEPSSENNLEGQWEIQITSKDVNDAENQLKINAWDSIFLITDRYAQEIERSARYWINEIVYDDLASKVRALTENDIIEVIKNYINDRFSTVKLTLNKISSTANLLPLHLFFKYLLQNNAIIVALILVFIKTPTGVDMSWDN